MCECVCVCIYIYIYIYIYILKDRLLWSGLFGTWLLLKVQNEIVPLLQLQSALSNADCSSTEQLISGEY